MIAGTLMIVGIGFLGMVTGSVATYFVDKLSKGQESERKSIADEQIDYVKKKLDELEKLEHEELKELWGVVVSPWERKRNSRTEI